MLKMLKMASIMKKVLKNWSLGDRGETFSYTVAYSRTRFKRCVSLCREAAPKIKTASGIKRFQEEKHFGSWFNPIHTGKFRAPQDWGGGGGGGFPPPVNFSLEHANKLKLCTNTLCSKCRK